MGSLFTASNLKTAAVVTLAVLIASNLTSGKGAILHGGAMFAGALVALPIAAKL